MKRKTKIITTIASLCLAVALMAFGVYAATTSSLGIQSKVQFVALDVDVTWNVKVSGGNVDPTKGAAAYGETYDETDETTYVGWDYQPWAAAAGYTFRSNNITGVEGVADTDNQTLVLTPQGMHTAPNEDDHYSFDPTDAVDGDTLTYEFSVTNNGGDAIKIQFTGTTLFAAGDDSHLTVTYSHGVSESLSTAAWASVPSVAAGATYVFKVTLENTNMTKSVAAKNLNVIFKAASVNNSDVTL